MPARPMALTPELVARCWRPVTDRADPPRRRRLTAEEHAALADTLLAEAGGPVVVFAYGSLIWNPGFRTRERRIATGHGWHRAFCIDISSWRATPEAPGLMMALARGGSCRGLLIFPDDEPAAVRALVEREIPFAYERPVARWITVATPDGPARALVFRADPRGDGISPGLALPEVARRIARACGYHGSNAEYLYNTVAHLEAEGIPDRNLWRLQALVAAEIAALQ